MCEPAAADGMSFSSHPLRRRARPLPPSTSTVAAAQRTLAMTSRTSFLLSLLLVTGQTPCCTLLPLLSFYGLKMTPQGGVVSR